MWGNALGWFISLVIVAGTVTGLAVLQRRITNVTSPTALATGENSALIVLPLPPETVLKPLDERDAGALYRDAIATFDADRQTYADFATRGTLKSAPDMPALQQLLAAAKHARADIFATEPSRIVNYQRVNPALEAIGTLGACAVRIALLEQPANPSDALRYADAAFALGVRLFEERITLAEMRAGMSLMDQGARLIAMCDPSRAAAANQFIDATRKFSAERIDPPSRAIVTIDANMIAQHSGDAFWFARNAQERMWRVEATLALGRLRFNAAQIGDQQAASRALQRLASDPDPAVRAAAEAARSLTIEQYRMQG